MAPLLADPPCGGAAPWIAGGFMLLVLAPLLWGLGAMAWTEFRARREPAPDPHQDLLDLYRP